LNTAVLHINNKFINRLYLYGILMKFKLSLTVVFSSVMAYLFSVDKAELKSVLVLSIGGLLITASANILNQIIEKDSDKLMNRTKTRPLPSNKLTIIEASILAGLTGVIGIALLSFYFNTLSGILGCLSLLSYAFIYTPMKKISPTAVFIGAIPGAMPLLIGGCAATNMITFKSLIFFGIQFLWQLPHFWSIAWLLDEDYKAGGFSLLPNVSGEKNRTAIIQSLPYLILLVLLVTCPFILGYSGIISLLIALIASMFYLLKGIEFVIKVDDKSARGVMFTSFAYIPIVLLSFVLDKL
jgi:protoheme IX farnesyltransferase